ncbi:Uncharacterised protein [Mycobacteroides abscessus subsp. bolletii]|nr:Uncharacterised protein [Mycobacteroides abscessus]SKF62025.1 Uncharacterised protein [Mycobacteroides abscessus subsp. bolletii]SKH91201.1 Uncharacterised protein [Mycobacteroides abscessus subsp. bolletii]
MAQNSMPVFEITGPQEHSPSAQRVRVLEQLDQTLAGLAVAIRFKKVPPVGEPVATLGRKLIELDEKYDAVNRTYTPGPAFDVLLDALMADSVAELVAKAIADGTFSVD